MTIEKGRRYTDVKSDLFKLKIKISISANVDACPRCGATPFNGVCENCGFPVV